MAGRTKRPSRISRGTMRLTSSARDGAKPMPALAPLGLAICGVDADQPAGGVEQRAAGVAGVDGGVGLDHAADGAAVEGLDLAVQRADDAGGQRLVQAEGVADGVDALADDRSRLLPSAIGGSLSLGGASMRSTARSRSGRRPPARRRRCSGRPASRAPLAPWMTWKLVTMWPRRPRRSRCRCRAAPAARSSRTGRAARPAW
jgi:hypothetical protein